MGRTHMPTYITPEIREDIRGETFRALIASVNDYRLWVGYFIGHTGFRITDQRNDRVFGDYEDLDDAITAYNALLGYNEED